ncbi:carbon starvation protein A [Candidatus Margulisiibacteriota bacterium]
MNISILLIVAVAVFAVAYRFYGRYLAKVFGENNERKTPAHEINDGVDFVPTKKGVLFAHHFSSIAGAGPIIGPTIAMLFGYIPVWLWIIIGTVFFGAVHDYAALFVSARENGKSIAEVAGKTFGKAGFLLFITFTIIMVVMVTAAFLGLTVKALTSLAPLSLFGLSVDQEILKTTTVDGVVMGKIGGIASTSVIIMTLIAPLIGYLIYKKKLNVLFMSAVAVVVAVIAILVGFLFPVTFPPLIWMILISVYTFIAAGIPIWIILQPRDFINVHILYSGILFLFFGIVVAAFKGAVINFPAFNVAQASAHPALGFIWPVLFITVACGAISGFHALVAGGTTSKQISNESHIMTVGFFGMLLESVLAVCVVITIAYGLSYGEYVNMVFPNTLQGSNPILAFAVATGTLLKFSFGLPVLVGTIFGILLVEGFVITTLDTSVRLNRYLLEELWPFIFKKVPKILDSYFFNSGICVLAMFFLAYTNAYITIWPIFGTGNQLLAALTLFVVAAWLINRGSKAVFVLVPAFFMLITTMASLFMLLFSKHIPTLNITLIIVDTVLLMLSIAMAAKAISIISGYRVAFQDGKFKLLREHEEDLVADKLHLG